MSGNEFHELMRYFSTAESPVDPLEFWPFWNSLNAAEKVEFKNAPLT